MFTNNYIAFRHNMFFGFSGSSAINYGGTTVSYKKMTNPVGSSVTFYADDDVVECDIGNSMGAQISNPVEGLATSFSATKKGVYFGSGTTPATREDYNLEATISSGLTVASGCGFFENDGNGKYSFYRDYVLTNTTEESITVSEIGCFTPVRINSSSSAQWWPILMERTVFPEPVIIQPNESKLITYKFVFNQMEA